MHALGVLPAEDFIAQRGAENTNHTVDGGGDEGDLDAARPGEIGEADVVVRADWIGGDFFAGILGRIGQGVAGGIGWGHGFWVRLLGRRRDV